MTEEVPMSYETLDTLGRRMVQKLREAAGAPQNAPAYLFWGQTPEELWKVLRDFAQNEALRAGIPPEILFPLRSVITRDGYTVMAILFHRGKLHLTGARVQVMPTAKA